MSQAGEGPQPRLASFPSAERVLETMATGFVSLDSAWLVRYVNAEAERILARSRDKLLGRNLWEIFPGADTLDFGREYRLTIETGEPRAFEAFYPAANMWFDLRTVPRPDGLEVYFLDVTRRRELQEATEQAAARFRLLSDVSEALSGSPDWVAAAAGLAELVTPVLADWCVITIADLDGTGGLADVGIAHRDPSQLEAVRAYAAAQLPGMTQAAPIWGVLRSGEPFVAPRIRPEILADVFPDARVRELLAVLSPTSGVAVPLAARGTVLGVLGLWISGDRPPLTRAEIELAADIGRRAGLALDSSRLASQHRRFSEALQRSLLTDPPRTEQLQIAVRYRPAAHELQVGGDWYDAFTAADGATVVAIGDVIGHDTQAAAAMGQLRGLLRGIAFTTNAGPAEVLTRVDAAVDGLLLRTMATAVLARIEPSPASGPGAATLTWSNAGHPRPVTVSPGGTVTGLGPDPDVLLGVQVDPDRCEHRAVLEAGSTLLLFTDGLIERRDSDLDVGLDRLHAVLTELRELPLEELCDEVLRRMLRGNDEDDVSLLAVRLAR